MSVTVAPARAPGPAPVPILRAYIGAVALGGAAITLFILTHYAVVPLYVLLCCVAAAVSERLKVAVTEETPISLSLSLAVILAAMVAFGAGAAVLAAISARLAVGLSRPRPALHKTVFNLGLYALHAGAAALVYEALGGGLGHRPVPQEVLAAVASFATALAVNWVLLLTVIHLATGRAFYAVWKEDLRWMPTQAAMSAAIGFTLGVTYLLYGWLGTAVYVLPLIALRESMRMYTSKVGAQMEELRLAHAETDLANQRLVATNEGLLKTLASVIDARDIYLYGHSVQASKYAAQVATTLKLPAQEVKLAELGALLHDLGKIGVSEAILNKPARLTDAEYEEIKSHCDIGYELLITLPGFEDVAEVVRSHHERYDGQGYPRGLKGDEIPMAARIISVVESVEAMVSDRPYRKGLNADEVLQELAQGAGSQWDPDVVAVFSNILSTDRKHLVMRNSALEVALARLPIGQLVNGDGAVHDPALFGMTQTFETAGQPIFVLDEEFHIVSVNPAAERVSGWTSQQLEGRAWIDLCAAEDLREGLGAAFFDGTRQMTLAGAHGRPVVLDVTGSPLRTNSASYWLVMAHDVTERVRVESDLKRKVGTDFVTGLANRESLETLFREAEHHGAGKLALVLLDMDYFKEINDTFGHAAGDATLRALGEAITAQLRDGDVGARIGGDEFALLLHVTRPEEIDPVVARVATALSARRMPGNPEFSYGHAIWDGRESYHALAHRADVAMYRDKAVRAAAPAIALRRAR